MADDTPIVDDADALFDLPAADFVAARDDLVRRLRADGDGDEADRVKALRRPTMAAWAVNRVVRQHPEDYAQLLTAGRALQQATRKAMSGVSDSGIREATTTRRDMVAALAHRAATILADAVARPDSHIDDVARTFEAASADPDVADRVGRGCLSTPLEPTTDFVGGQVPLAAAPAGRGDDDDDGEGIDPEVAEQRRTAMRALVAATSAADTSAAAARDARRQATVAAERATEARRSATEAREAAERAEARADDLEAAADRAEQDASEASATAERDAEAAEQARAALDALA